MVRLTQDDLDWLNNAKKHVRTMEEYSDSWEFKTHAEAAMHKIDLMREILEYKIAEKS